MGIDELAVCNEPAAQSQVLGKFLIHVIEAKLPDNAQDFGIVPSLGLRYSRRPRFGNPRLDLRCKGVHHVVLVSEHDDVVEKCHAWLFRHP